MRAVFTARLVWLVMEISDNSREMENYDQPESHALCHHNLFQGCGLDFCLFFPNLSFSFNTIAEKSASQTRGGKSATEITVCVCACARTGLLLIEIKATEIACAVSPPVVSERLFFHVVFSGQLINLRRGIMGCQPSVDGRAAE